MDLPAQLDEAQLKQVLAARDDLLLVDVRSTDEFAAEPREGWQN